LTIVSIGNLRTLADSAESDDPIEALQAIVQLRQEADRALAVAVRRARVSGASWQLIAHTIGVSRQGVHKRFGRA
jgi:hypothetical protein